jgi:hypothetical protein
MTYDNCRFYLGDQHREDDESWINRYNYVDAYGCVPNTWPAVKSLRLTHSAHAVLCVVQVGEAVHILPVLGHYNTRHRCAVCTCRCLVEPLACVFSLSPLLRVVGRSFHALRVAVGYGDITPKSSREMLFAMGVRVHSNRRTSPHSR